MNKPNIVTNTIEYDEVKQKKMVINVKSMNSLNTGITGNTSGS